MTNKKMGLDDFLIEYEKGDLTKLMEKAKKFDTLDMQLDLLLKGISSVNDG